MLRFLNNRQAPAPPTATAPAPHINLKTAIGRMPVLSPEAITDTFKAYIAALESNSPEAMAGIIADMNLEQRTTGDPHKDGPHFALVNTGGESIDIMASLNHVPATGSGLPDGSPFITAKFIATINDRLNPAEAWVSVPIEPQQVFG